MCRWTEWARFLIKSGVFISFHGTKWLGTLLLPLDGLQGYRPQPSKRQGYSKQFCTEIMCWADCMIKFYNIMQYLVSAPSCFHHLLLQGFKLPYPFSLEFLHNSSYLLHFAVYFGHPLKINFISFFALPFYVLVAWKRHSFRVEQWRLPRRVQFTTTVPLQDSVWNLILTMLISVCVLIVSFCVCVFTRRKDFSFLYIHFFVDTEQ